MMLFPACARYFYHTMQVSPIVYKRTNFIWHMLVLAAEAVTMQSIYEFLARTKGMKIVAEIFSRCLIILQLFQFGIAMFDLAFNYALMMRCAGDIPLAYYVVSQPIMFKNTETLSEGMKKLEYAKLFLIHCYEGQKI